MGVSINSGRAPDEPGPFESFRVNGKMGDGLLTGVRFLPAQE